MEIAHCILKVVKMAQIQVNTSQLDLNWIICRQIKLGKLSLHVSNGDVIYFFVTIFVTKNCFSFKQKIKAVDVYLLLYKKSLHFFIYTKNGFL